ncbi:MAG TPA: hypothetical protein PK816_15990 [Candidatus Cloacimonadota bacterium]|nr:hypothetical protein [Candidatus Cloacimonadota bacterium]
MQNKVVVFDVGTNNVQILLAELIEGKVLTRQRFSEVSALGKDMKNRYLSEDALKRFYAIIDSYMPVCKSFSNNIIIAGTSCSRDALNISLIKNYLEEKHSLIYRILSSEEEAFYNGLANADEFQDELFVTFDIGGGSTEFSLIENHQVKDLFSLDLGIRRLNNKYQGDFKWMETETDSLLAQIPPLFFKKCPLVGIGGTVANISAVKQGLKEYSSEKVHQSVLTLQDIVSFIDCFKTMSFEEISEKMPFEPQRAEIIGTGLMIILKIMILFKVEQIKVSDHGLMYGIAHEFLNPA